MKLKKMLFKFFGLGGMRKPKLLPPPPAVKAKRRKRVSLRWDKHNIEQRAREVIHRLQHNADLFPPPPLHNVITLVGELEEMKPFGRSPAILAEREKVKEELHWAMRELAAYMQYIMEN